MIELNEVIKISKASLSGEDYFVLSQMYNPLIGVDGVCVYLGLNNLIDNEIVIRSFLDILKLKNVLTLEHALNRCEGIGLIKRFKSNSTTLFEVIKPLSSRSFLNNPILSTSLETQIGSVSYLELRKKILTTTHKGYKDISKKFDEVFESVNYKVTSGFVEEVIDPLKLKSDHFDYIVFKLSFQDHEIDNQLLDIDEFKDFVLKLSFLYKLDEVEMKNAILNSIKYKKDVDLEDIKKQAGFIYQKKESFASFKPREVEMVDYNLTEEENILLTNVSNKPIAITLSEVSGGKGSLGDVRDFIKLMEQTEVSLGVINLLIYDLTYNSNTTSWSYTYIEKALRNWMKKGVKTTVDAIIYLREKNTTKPKNKKIMEETSYKEVCNDELSEEELEKAIDLKKKLFGE